MNNAFLSASKIYFDKFADKNIAYAGMIPVV